MPETFFRKMDNETEIHRSSSEDVNINSLLDDDCLKIIIECLPVIDWFNVEQVCQRWQTICGDLWKSYRRFDIIADCFSQNGVDYAYELGKRVLKKCAPYVVEVNLSSHERPHPRTVFNTIFSPTNYPCPSRETMHDIKEILSHCNNIEKLTLDAWSYNEDELSNLLSKIKKIRFLYLENVRWKKDSFLPVPFENLETFILCNESTIGFFDLQALRKATKLKCLSLHGLDSNVRNVIDDFLPENLEQLDINWDMDGVRVSDVVSKVLSRGSLKVLALSEVDEGYEDMIAAMTRHCHNLQALSLFKCSEVQLNQINASLSKLICLDISWSDASTDFGISNVSENLKVLVAQRNFFTDTGIAHLLQRAQHLEKLDLSHGYGFTENIVDIAVNAMRLRLSENNLTPLEISIRTVKALLPFINEIEIGDKEYPELLLKFSAREMDIDYDKYIHL